jgi:hypothetical protein
VKAVRPFSSTTGVLFVRAHPLDCHQVAVDRPDQRPGEEPGQDAEPHVVGGVERGDGHDAGEGQHRADRKVKLTGNQQERHADSRDQIRRDVAQQIEIGAPRARRGHGNSEEGSDQQEEGKEEDFLMADKRQQEATHAL